MMPTSFHHKQPFNPSGDLYGNSVSRTMKSQPIALWDMFTRETLQNSWDARDRKSDTDGVTFAIDHKTLDTRQTDVLRKNVFGADFEGLPELESLLESKKVPVLQISDSGTNGLRGPSASGIAVDGPTDFIAFVRNIGRSDTKELAGGTYGFGKGVFFIASKVSTIVIYTRTVDENNLPVNRFIAMANTDDFSMDGQEYTGRHWWGVRSIGGGDNNRQEFAEPFTGDVADEFAAALGMDTYFTEERITGTSIMLLAPNLDGDSEESSGPEGIMKYIAASLTRWAWPHMLNIETGMDPIEFRVSNQGELVPVPDPERDPALKHFIRAYKAALNAPRGYQNSWKSDFFQRTSQVWTSRPSKILGSLGVVNLPDSIEATSTVAGIDIFSHIALIRNPRMIVQYYSGPAAQTNRPYCGVFIADRSADKVFARSEPAAHHEWNHQSIQQDVALLTEFWEKKIRNNPVRIFFNKLNDLLKNPGSANELPGDGKHYQSVTALSTRLGRLVDTSKRGNATTVQSPSNSASTSAPKKNAMKPSAVVNISELRPNRSGIDVTFRVEISIPQHSTASQLYLEPVVVSDRGMLRLGDFEGTGLEFPSILDWASSNDVDTGTQRTGSITNSELRLNITKSQTLSIVVHQPPDCAISLKTRFVTQGFGQENGVEV